MKIALIIILCLIIFILVHVLISQLDDLCEYERRFTKALRYIDDVRKYTSMPINTIVALRTIERILLGEDKE